MKSPRSLRPSGDRKIAELFISALKQGGFEVDLASEFRSWEGHGDQQRQLSIQAQGEEIADQLMQHYRDVGNAPDCWFTYHVYHKAPDWVGPKISKALNIPYCLAEASVAGKQQSGSWSNGFKASVSAVQHANLVFNINPTDKAGLAKILGDDNKIISLAPFLDQSEQLSGQKNILRNNISARTKINPDRYWLLTVAMMRDDTKLESYLQLAKSIERLQRKDWSLLIVGDGPTELTVREYFRFDFDRRVYFLGKRDAVFIRNLMSAADLLVWPAINEAIGMVALEALACGLPSVWGQSGGIGEIIANGETGLIVESPGNDTAPDRIAESIESLLAAPGRLSAMSDAARIKFSEKHQLKESAEIIAAAIRRII